MHAKDAILATYDFGDRIVNAYLGDLSDADLLVRPVDGQNHIAWQVGHLLLTENGLLNMMKPGSSPELPAGFAESYGRDEASTKSDDPSRFLGKDQYLALWSAQRAATRAYVKAVDDAELDAPGPERVRKMCPTVGTTLLLLGNHPMMHVGQFVSVRRKLNKPVAI